MSGQHYGATLLQMFCKMLLQHRYSRLIQRREGFIQYP